MNYSMKISSAVMCLILITFIISLFFHLYHPSCIDMDIWSISKKLINTNIIKIAY